MDRLRGRFESWRGKIDRRLRGVLDGSASPSCCSVDKVAFVRTLLPPEEGETPSRGFPAAPEEPEER